MFSSLRKSMKSIFTSFDQTLNDLEAPFKDLDKEFDAFDQAFAQLPQDAQEQRTTTEETRADGTRVVTTTVLRRVTTKKTP